MELEERLALINKPPIEEITNFDLVNKPPIDELYHHGVLGMHWGIRRYQNPDGSLTPAGQRRMQKKMDKAEKKQRKKDAKEQKRREAILRDPKALERNIDKFSSEEVTRAMQNFKWQEDIKELRKQRSDKAWNKAIDLANKANAMGQIANNAISFLNTPAGKELRNRLGFGTEPLGYFPTKEELFDKAEKKKLDDLNFRQQSATTANAELNYAKNLQDWEWTKADRNRQETKNQIDLNSTLLKYRKDQLDYRNKLRAAESGKTPPFDPDDYEVYDPEDEEKKYRLRAKHSATNDFRAYSDYLMHYGVKGMKWGVRRYQDKNGRLTAEGKEHYGKGSSASDTKEGIIIPVGLMVYAGMAVIGGAAVAIDSAVEAGKAKARNKRLYKDDNPNKITPENLKKVNPKWGDSQYSNNCTKCAATTELVARGISDYQAGKSNGGYNSKQYVKWFKGAKIKEVTSTETALRDHFDKLKSGNSGVLGLTYEGGFSGHAIHWTKLPNGDVRFEDGQIGKSYNLKEFMDTYKPASSIPCRVIRLDNCEPDYKKMREDEVIEPIKKKG